MMIKAAKKAIVVIMGNSDVTDEKLTTAFTGAEALINPHNDVLTTYYTIHGQIGGIFASEAAEEVTYQPLNRWQRIQELTRHFLEKVLTRMYTQSNPKTKMATVKK